MSAQSGNPVTTTRSFGYDALGNRVSGTVDATGTNLYYAPNANRLSQMQGVIPAGYLGGATALTFSYNNANRLSSVASGGTTIASYAVNALGQRVSKTVGTTTTLFVYDEQGRLVGEYDGGGNLIEETVWLEDLPIATLRPTGSGTPTPIAVYYVHPDHLGSPRAITRPTDNAFVWRWDNAEPFGANAANENPSGLGSFTYNLRFPGQYYDAETGLHYNYFRDYDPTIGRYAESDPIGLKGGLNTYAYVKGNPLSMTDPYGLRVQMCCRLLDSVVAGTVGRQRHCYFDVDGVTYGLYPGPGDGGGTVGIPRIGDPRDKGGDCADCKSKPCSDAAQCVKDAAATYPTGGYSYGGPNSNTFAGYIARFCCAGGVPPGLGSAPGIDDPVPKPR